MHVKQKSWTCLYEKPFLLVGQNEHASGSLKSTPCGLELLSRVKTGIIHRVRPMRLNQENGFFYLPSLLSFFFFSFSLPLSFILFFSGKRKYFNKFDMINNNWKKNWCINMCRWLKSMIQVENNRNLRKCTSGCY